MAGVVQCDVADSPAVRYARAGSVSVAYQRVGDRPETVVAIPPMAQNIELMWERPEYRRMLERIASFATLVHFDKRGTGASDRTAHIPTMDERVEDLKVVMDHAGVERAHLLGVSEGGPVALAFAATYPQRVHAVALVSSGARIIGDESEEQRAGRRAWFEVFVDRWGTDASLTVDVFSPSASTDPTYRAWQPRYERQSASPAAVREVLQMMETIDVRPLLASITAPVVVLHRRDDPIVSRDLAREVVEGVAGARLVELDGVDHAPHIGDVGSWLDHLEELVTGSVQRDVTATVAAPGRAAIRTMGGFGVRIDGEDVPLTAWGSRQARQLCKRLAVAAGQPVPRDELVEMLWPDEDDLDRLGARLSVLLSNVRRVLGGGLVADRGAVALDLDAVGLDLDEIYRALAQGDDAVAVAAHRGPLLPEDAYDEWAEAARQRLVRAIVGARRRLATRAASASQLDEVAGHAAVILELDPYDERAHELLVRTLSSSGRHGDAARAERCYRERMADLGVRPQSLLDDA